jgi:hypothetical protein
MKLTTALLFLLGTVAIAAQQPQIQNGQVETRRATSLDRDIAAIASTATEPTWVGWREVAVSGSGNNCCWYQWDNEPGQRGCPVEPAATDKNGNVIPSPRPEFPAPTGPVKLEAGTEILVMVRIVDKQVERIRNFSDDCPLDAGGRKVIWLDGVTAADSVRYLQSLISLKEQPGVPQDMRRRLNSWAISAIGQHRDASVDALIALAKQNQDSSARSSAFNALGRSKDPKAFAFIDGILRR